MSGRSGERTPIRLNEDVLGILPTAELSAHVTGNALFLDSVYRNGSG